MTGEDHRVHRYIEHLRNVVEERERERDDALALVRVIVAGRDKTTGRCGWCGHRVAAGRKACGVHVDLDTSYYGEAA